MLKTFAFHIDTSDLKCSLVVVETFKITFFTGLEINCIFYLVFSLTSRLFITSFLKYNREHIHLFIVGFSLYLGLDFASVPKYKVYSGHDLVILKYNIKLSKIKTFDFSHRHTVYLTRNRACCTAV